MMTSRYGLPDKAIRQLQQIFTEYPQIRQVILYGSRAKGNYRNGSDIDLTIDGDIDIVELLQIENQIDDLLLPWSVDLSILAQIENSDLVAHIKRCGVMFYP